MAQPTSNTNTPNPIPILTLEIISDLLLTWRSQNQRRILTAQR